LSKTHHFESDQHERNYIPLSKRGNEGDFLENNLTNLPWPLFFKEGIERSETAVGQGVSRDGEQVGRVFFCDSLWTRANFLSAR